MYKLLSAVEVISCHWGITSYSMSILITAQSCMPKFLHRPRLLAEKQNDQRITDYIEINIYSWVINLIMVIVRRKNSKKTTIMTTFHSRCDGTLYLSYLRNVRRFYRL